MKYFKNSAINIFLIGAFITSFSNVMVGQPKITYSDSKTNGFRAAVIKVNITPETPQLLSGYEPRVSAGNIAPIYSYPNHVDNHPIHLSQLNQFRELLGDKILDAFKKITDSTDEVTLKTGSIIVETPRVPELEFSSILNEYIRTTDSGVKLARLPIRFLKINQETAIWSAPVELFCEISNEIRNQSPFPYTFFFGYTNGSLGYLVTENAYKHGGYEPSVSPFSPQVASDLTEAVLTYLQGELKSDKLVKE